MAKVLGISGFENSIPFKKDTGPAWRSASIAFRKDTIRGRFCSSMEKLSQAALKNALVARNIPRLPGQRNSVLPDMARITADELDEIAHGFDYTAYRAAFLLDATSAEQYDQVFSRAKFARLSIGSMSEFSSGQSPPGKSPLAQRLAPSTPQDGRCSSW